MLGPIRISSRQPFRPLIIGLAIAGWYVWKYSRAEREADGRWLQRWAARALPFAVPLAVLLARVPRRSITAASRPPDPIRMDIVSQARLWLSGIPRVEQPWVQDFSWPNREWVFSPLGYRPFSPDGTIVPTYPAGLPMLMAVSFWPYSGTTDRFMSCPVSGRAARCGSPTCSARKRPAAEPSACLAALLLLASPVFLTHLMVPMSDVPAAAGWTLVAVLVLKQRPLAAGLCRASTLLVRPNLDAAGAGAGVRMAAKARAARSLCHWHRARSAGDHGHQHASLWRAAVDRLRIALRVVFAGARCRSTCAITASGCVQTQTPLILLALVPLFVPRARCAMILRRVSPRACLGGDCRTDVPVVSVLRDLQSLVLSAVPASGVSGAVRPAGSGDSLAGVEAAVRSAGAGGRARVRGDDSVRRQRRPDERESSVSRPSSSGMSAPRTKSRHGRRPRRSCCRFSTAAACDTTPTESTLRYDWLEEGALDGALRDLAAKGRRAYLVVDDWEEKEFRARFSPANRAGRLDWAPIARVPGSPEVRIFDLQDGGPAPAQ